MMKSVFIIVCALIVTTHSTADQQCGIAQDEDDCPTSCEVNSCPTHENYNRTCPKPDICPPRGCKCRFNYSKASNGTCIPTRECPPFFCSKPNEEYSPCPAYCPTDDCSQATPDGRCPLFGHLLIVVQCRPTCRCKKGFWRLNGVCVPYDECPQLDKGPSLKLYPPFFFAY